MVYKITHITILYVLKHVFKLVETPTFCFAANLFLRAWERSVPFFLIIFFYLAKLSTLASL